MCNFALILILLTYVHAQSAENKEIIYTDPIEDPLAPIRENAGINGIFGISGIKANPWEQQTIGKTEKEIDEQYGKPIYVTKTKDWAIAEYSFNGLYILKIYVNNGIVQKASFSYNSFQALKENEITNLLDANKTNKSEKWSENREEFNNIIYFLGDGDKLRAYLTESGTCLWIACKKAKDFFWIEKAEKKVQKDRAQKYILQIGDCLESVIKRNGTPRTLSLLGGTPETEILCRFNGYECGIWYDDYFSYLVLFLKGRLESLKYCQSIPMNDEMVYDILNGLNETKNGHWRKKDEEYIYNSYWYGDGDELRAYINIESNELTICSNKVKSILRTGINP